MAIKDQRQVEGESMISRITNSIKNTIQNTIGIGRTFQELIDSNDIDKALNLFINNDKEVDIAISEYDPEQHEQVLSRPNKRRGNKETYISEKLPRALQKHINESEVYFLLNNEIEFRNDTIVTEQTAPASKKAFDAFMQMLKDTRFHTYMREAKRLAGAETESAKYYRVFRNLEGKLEVKCNVLAASKGYRLRPLFDEFNTMIAFAWKYKIKDEAGKVVDRIEVEMPNHHFIFTKRLGGWEKVIENNITGKINIVYYKQEKAWKGAQRRITRLEMIDSKIADVNNYFSAPKLIVPTDMISSLPDSPLTAGAGEVIEVTGDYQNANALRYLEMPTAPALQQAEIDNIIRTIREDTFTPPYSFSDLVGIGTLSDDAMMRAMTMGYIKRNILKEIYDIAIEREISIVKNILPLCYGISKDVVDALVIGFEFAEPMPSDDIQKMSALGELYEKGAISAETIVEQLNLYSNFDEEVERIKTNQNTTINNTIT